MLKHLHHPVRHHLRRATLGLATAALLVGCGSDDPSTGDGAGDGPAAESAAPAPAVTTEATAAASWLAGQLDGGLASSSYEDPPGSGTWVTMPDYGLSLDVLFALRPLEEHADDRAAILDALEPAAASYIGAGRTAYAGSTGKLLTAVQVEERDPATYADTDLVARLERLVQRKGDELGRAKDRWDPADEFGGDYSNTIGQSWVVRGLVDADSGLADEATTFLLAQQCSDGFFRLLMESEDHTCDSGTGEESVPSVDATAFAVQALLEVQEADVAGVDVAGPLEEAGDWLLGEQAEDGSFVDADSGEANANSTGVAAEALQLLGEEAAAASAQAWLVDHQVTPETGGKLGRHPGAGAFDDAALDAAQQKGITRAVRYQWQRATAQAVAGLAGAAAGGAASS